jgi:hypothetical protein
MPELKQYTITCRDDWWPIHREVCKVLSEVLEAGEIQRLSKGLDPNGWMTADPLKRLNHVMHHLLKCHHHNSLSVLTEDTCIEQWKHSLCGLGIIAYLEAKPDNQGVVIETPDD